LRPRLFSNKQFETHFYSGKILPERDRVVNIFPLYNLSRFLT
jgi:hypothetical protein